MGDGPEASPNLTSYLLWSPEPVVTFSPCCWVRKLESRSISEYPWQLPQRGLGQARCHSEPALPLQAPVCPLWLRPVLSTALRSISPSLES